MKIQCNICHSKQTKKLFTSQNIHGRFIQDKSDHFEVYQCKKCKNVFLGKLVINKNYYKKYYSQGYYIVDLGNPILNSIIKIMDRFSFFIKEKLILSKINKSSNIEILDVGCGIGMFLSHLNSKKFRKYGVEINKKGAQEARKKNITVYTSDFLKLRLKQKFDVITMWHVLEHIPQPELAVKKVREMLRLGGLFVFAVPNSDCIGFRFGKKNWYHLDSPRHIFIPNRSNLKNLLIKHKFDVLKIMYEFYDYPIDLLVSVKDSLIKYFIYPFYPFFKFFDQETLTFVARK